MPIPGNWLRDNEFMAPTKPGGKINMAENQHRKIKGYRELSEEEIALMNQIKEKAAEVGDLYHELMQGDADQRWLAIGRTQLQQGFMALTRSIAKPDFF